ncbi:MAG: hypothetical protein RMZ69_18395 [Nostoc sp. ChiQUE01a]|uniref:hypothetical protein n=1 Tax=Nostoc sp. CCY 9925 TaxID=3103865 RepID=UPI002AD85FDC|nr:hypothetical protein [Nostoc sp. DedQUE11]MDZ8074548.1 hypothetical protein [Nostoc sp. DedQUE01]MDZ8077655.1 hypothetical protein [Nostoc sp. DcaGUA01]MDZ8239088.1 hypothetical protein [Nostoc sp. ChiQUE01a]
MKKPFLQITRLFLATAAGVSFAPLLMAQPSLAQLSSPADAFPSGSTTDQNTDPFSRSNSDNFNMFDLIHRANFGTLNWNSQQQNEQLNSTAEAFKARQQQLLQCRQQGQLTTPGSPTVASASPTSSTQSATADPLKANQQQTLQCQQAQQTTRELPSFKLPSGN